MSDVTDALTVEVLTDVQDFFLRNLALVRISRPGGREYVQAIPRDLTHTLTMDGWNAWHVWTDETLEYAREDWDLRDLVASWDLSTTALNLGALDVHATRARVHFDKTLGHTQH